ncbi:MAG: hypothetical protein ACRDE2_07955, partial [Chitinophagaceae bacterium]
MKRQFPYFDIAGLIVKSLKRDITTDESEQLESWIAENKKNERLWQKFSDPEYLEKHLKYWEQTNNDLLWEKIVSEISTTQTSRKVEFRKYLRYAAVFLPLILLSGMGVYWANHHGKNRSVLQPDSNKG